MAMFKSVAILNQQRVHSNYFQDLCWRGKYGISMYLFDIVKNVSAEKKMILENWCHPLAYI